MINNYMGGAIMNHLIQQTVVIIKPDAVSRGLIGEIIGRYEKKGLIIKEMAFMIPSVDTLRNHYIEHTNKSFFNSLIEFMSSGAVVVMIMEGLDAVNVVRGINGATNYKDALPGTIRGEYALDITKNLVHGSDSIESALREKEIWFRNEEKL